LNIPGYGPLRKHLFLARRHQIRYIKSSFRLRLNEEMSLPKSPTQKNCNPLCKKCLRTCRQPTSMVLVDCPRFMPLPFKVDKHDFDQLDLFAGPDQDPS